MTFVRKSLKEYIWVLAVLIPIFIVGCSSSNEDTTGNPDQNGSSSSSKTDSVSIDFYMGPPDGTWAPIARAFAANLEDMYPELTVNVEPGGGAANMEIIQNGEGDIGMVFSTSAYDGWNANAPFTESTDQIRQLGVLFPMHWYLVTPDNSDINSLEDIAGKRVNVGRRGSSSELASWILLDELGIGKDDITVERLGEADAFSSMKDGHLDLSMQFGATPYPPLMDIATTQDVKILSIPNEIANGVLEKNQGLIKATLPTSAYPDVLDSDVATMSSSVNLIVNADVPADVVEKVVQGLHEMQDQLKSNFAFMEVSKPEDIAADIGIPFHEGAESYYKEQGWLE